MSESTSQSVTSQSRRIKIFDTTLRDGEQSPGCSMNLQEKLEMAAAKLGSQGDQPIDGNRKAPPKGGDGSVGAAGNVGGYNTGWLDPGSTLTVVDGQARSSIVIDPPNGRVPPLTPAARERTMAAALRAQPTSDTRESNDPGVIR